MTTGSYVSFLDFPHCAILSADCDRWQGRLLADALWHIHGLLLLKILVPQTLPLRTVIIPGVTDTGLDELAREGGKRREMERVRVVNALPRPPVDAIPSRRYLSVADMVANPAFEIDASEWVGDVPSSGAEDGVMYEWDKLREVDTVRTQMWWKIIEEDGERKMVEISESEGEHARSEIEYGDLDMTVQAEGKSTLPLSRAASTHGQNKTLSHRCH